MEPTDESKVPCKRSFHKMLSVGEDLYMFGGCGTSGRLADLHSFNTKSNKWKKLSGADSVGCKGRGGANFVASIAQQALFVICGFAGEETNDFLQNTEGTAKTPPKIASVESRRVRRRRLPRVISPIGTYQPHQSRYVQSAPTLHQ